MPINLHIKFLIAGELNQEFVIDLAGKPANHYAGGSLLYAAAGASMWHDGIGLIGRVGSNFPSDWIAKIDERGLDTRGILHLPQVYDQRSFYFWRDAEHCIHDSPVSAYAHYGLTFPHDLLGYTTQTDETTEKMWRNVSPHLNPTFPTEYMDISAAHLCPLSVLQKSLINTVSISPSNDYMNPAGWKQLPAILKDTSVFVPTETQLLSLFQGRSNDIWEMTLALTELGCPIIVVDCGKKGYCLYNAVNNAKIVLPFYPSRWLNPTGVPQVFAGAFLAQYKEKYDPLQALISGAVSASLAVEGSGPFYCLDSFSGLASARAEVLQSMLKKI
jgi:sugar/nucleoside kinase (ribokinase family)